MLKMNGAYVNRLAKDSYIVWMSCFVEVCGHSFRQLYLDVYMYLYVITTTLYVN